MHESIAKAYVKRDIRCSINHTNDIQAYWSRESSKKEDWQLKGRKQVLKFVDDHISAKMKVALAVFEKARHSSWHKQIIQSFVLPKAAVIEGIGKVYPILVQSFDTRKLLKGGPNGYALFYTDTVVHEHFLMRFKYRLDPSRQPVISKMLFASLFNLAMLNCQECRHMQNGTVVYHILCQDSVIITTYDVAACLFIFNTVLVRAQFSDGQEAFYSSIYKTLSDNHWQTGIYSELTGSVESTDIEFTDTKEILELSHMLLKRVSDD